MKVPRICTNCLHVVAPKPVMMGPDEEENRKLEVIDAQMRCPKCRGKLTKFIHHVINRVDDPDVLKQFGVTTNDALKNSKVKFAEYVQAKKDTEEQAKKDIEEGKRRLRESI